MKRKKPQTPPHIVEADIPNPNHNPAHAGKAGNPATIRVSVNAGESPIAWYYHHRSQTGFDELHLRAGDKFRRLYERVGGSGVQAMDYAKEPVDGGRVSDGMTEARHDAGKQLAEAHKEIGEKSYRIVEAVCGDRAWLKQLFPNRKDARGKMQELKAALEKLGKLWNLAK